MRLILCVLVTLMSVKSFAQYSEALLRSAENGSVNAQVELAKCYRDGDGIDKDVQEALNWYEKAAEKGNLDAMVACGDLLCDECDEWLDMEADYVRGISWYRRAASRGSKRAKQWLANFIIEKEAISHDCPFTWLPCDEHLNLYSIFKSTINYIKQEYDKKNPVAAYYLAIISYVDGDYPSTVKYLTEIYPIDEEHLEDIFEYDDGSLRYRTLINTIEGEIYSTQIYEVHYIEDDIFEDDGSQRYRDYTIGPGVFSLLGYCYEFGLGVKKDYAKAAEYYLTESESYLCCGMPTTPKVRGAYCYKKAGLYDKFIAEVNSQKYPLSHWNQKLKVPCLQLELAEMYKTGEGVENNLAKALEIYESIVDNREELLQVYHPEFRSYSDFGRAAYRASQMYKKGEGCKADRRMAELYFELALKYGDKNAWYDYQNK